MVHPVRPCRSFRYLSADGLSERGSTATASARCSSDRELIVWQLLRVRVGGDPVHLQQLHPLDICNRKAHSESVKNPTAWPKRAGMGTQHCGALALKVGTHHSQAGALRAHTPTLQAHTRAPATLNIHAQRGLACALAAVELDTTAPLATRTRIRA
eukprot:scaffold232220_cov36-Tisochrysis_lutea.AAC.6